MADKLSISKERTAELIKEFGKGEGDSGSPEVPSFRSASAT